MHALMDLLAEALQHHGYNVTAQAALEGRTGTVYTIPLLAERDERAYIIDAHLEGVVPANVPVELADVRDDVGADGCVLAHLQAIESHDADIVAWGRDALVRFLGEAALAAATGTEAAAPDFSLPALDSDAPVAQSLSELLPPAFAADEAEFDGPELPDFSLLDLEQLGDEPTIEAGEMPAPKPTDFMAELDALVDPEAAVEATFAPELSEATGAPAPAAAPVPSPVPETRFPLLPVRCTANEAAGMVRERLFEARSVQMVLHPVFLFDYECDLLAEGSLRYDTVAGRIQVHGTHKHVLDVDPEAIDPTGFGRPLDAVPHEEKALRIDEDRAKQLGRDFLTEAHTRLVDVQVDDDDSGYAYTEKRKVAPRPDHVRLAAKGVFHRITWRVFGPNGHIDVDGMTGTVQEQRLQTPDPDVYIMD